MAKKSVKKIADFGEKIEGAKKDLWRTRGGLTVADYNSLTDGEKKKYLRRDEIWQKPDLLTKIQSGEISRTAGWIQNQLRTKISLSAVTATRKTTSTPLSPYAIWQRR